MKAIFLRAMLLGGTARSCGQRPIRSCHLPACWRLGGRLGVQGNVHHLVLHMNTTPEGKMTVLLDDIDLKISGVPPIAGSFDGSRLMLRFTYWKPNSSGDLEPMVASYEATVNESTSEMTGVWTQEGSWPLNFKRMTWQAKISKPAPPTVSTAIGRAWNTRQEVSKSTLSFTFTIPRTG